MVVVVDSPLCSRCINVVTLGSITYETLPGHNIESLTCPSCASCISLKIDGVIRTVEEVLEHEKMINGWHTVNDDNELLAHYVLSQIIYRKQERPQAERNECEFDLPDDSDLVRILWCNKKAIGFYTLKLEGTYVEHRQEHYAMTTLDTAYIRSEYRRNGLGISILEDIKNNHPDEDIGFSYPIAPSMLKVIEKFIKLYPDMKYKLWEIHGTGSEGSKKLAWFSVKKSQISKPYFSRVGPSL